MNKSFALLVFRLSLSFQTRRVEANTGLKRLEKKEALVPLSQALFISLPLSLHLSA